MCIQVGRKYDSSTSDPATYCSYADDKLRMMYTTDPFLSGNHDLFRLLAGDDAQRIGCRTEIFGKHWM